MRDIPVFTTENGAASLVLSQIPYRACAYITIQAANAPTALLEECMDFCVAAGAEKIYAAGDSSLEAYPLHTAVIRMCCDKESIEDTDCALFPVQDKTLELWRSIYNEKMADVPNAAYMTAFAAQTRLKEGGLYFVHRENSLLGIGAITDEKVEAIAAVVPGSGKDVMCALCHGIFSEQIQLEVAQSNDRAMGLYRKMGFIPVAEISKWYCVK